MAGVGAGPCWHACPSAPAGMPGCASNVASPLRRGVDAVFEVVDYCESMSNRTEVRLADGRRLYYFDDAPGADRAAPDRRALPPTATSSQIRWDPLFRDWA